MCMNERKVGWLIDFAARGGWVGVIPLVCIAYWATKYSIGNLLYDWGWIEEEVKPSFVLGEAEVQHSNQSAVEVRDATSGSEDGAGSVSGGESDIWPHPDKEGYWCAELSPLRGGSGFGTAWSVLMEMLAEGLANGSEDQYLVYRDGDLASAPEINNMHGDPKSGFLYSGDVVCISGVNNAGVGGQ